MFLLNVVAGIRGEFSLDSSTTNSVGTIAATTHAEVDFQNSGALIVGAVNSVPEGVTSFGILTNNHDVTLCALAGDISLTQALNAGTGTARLSASGAVTQTAASPITAANLGVAAGGNIGLDQAANAIPGTVALNSTGGSVAFMETDGFTVGTITASDCFPGATGITGGARHHHLLGSWHHLDRADRHDGNGAASSPAAASRKPPPGLSRPRTWASGPTATSTCA